MSVEFKVKLSEEQIVCNIATLFPTLAKTCYREIAKMRNEQATTAHDCGHTVNLLYDDSDDDDDQAPGFVANIGRPKSVQICVALDSGATDNVIDPDDLPEGVELKGPVGEPFKDASGGDIKKFGRCITLLENEDTNVCCGWTAFAVTRPLQSVREILGPEGGPGVKDVMFNNRIGVVMPPGLLEMLLKQIKPVAKYPRRGDLYVGDF